MVPSDVGKLDRHASGIALIFILVFGSVPRVATASELGMAPLFVILALGAIAWDGSSGRRPTVS